MLIAIGSYKLRLMIVFQKISLCDIIVDVQVCTFITNSVTMITLDTMQDNG